MKSKLYSAVVSKLVLSLGILIVLAFTASGQDSWTALANTPDLVPEYTEYLPLADPPFTEYVYQQANVGAGATGAAIATCPSTSIVVGGGYAAHPDVAFYTQYKYGNGWRGDARNNFRFH